MTEVVKPSAAALREALALSDDILRGIELSTSTLTSSALKASRLARLLGDFAMQKVFEYEAGGYPTTPGGVQPDVWACAKLAGIYDNLQSENPEDWSNAVHSCRRVLQDLADALFPPTDTPREKTGGGKSIEIKLGPDHYINRLMCFAEDHEKSERSAEIIGSQLTYLGNRLDALFQAAQKGSHSVISSRDEADRYVVYTYMLVGDLLRVRQSTIAA